MARNPKSKSKLVKFELYCNVMTENNPNGDNSWKYGPDNSGTEIQFGEHICTETVLYRNSTNDGWVSNANTRDYTGWKRTRITLPVEFIGLTQEEVLAEGFTKNIMVDVFKDKISLGDGIEPIEG